MNRPGPHAPRHEDPERRPEPMNNDTPQVFGEDTHGYPHSADSDDGEDFPAFRGWAGWGDRVEPVAPDDYPQPSFSGYEAAYGYPRELGFAEDPGYGRGTASGGWAPAGAEAVPVPPMEQLPDSDDFFDFAIPVAG